MDITNSIISDALNVVDQEIVRLTEVRESLLALTTEEAHKPTRPATSRVKSTKTTARKPVKAQTSGEDKMTRRDEIIMLLEDNWSPKEIADELDIKPNYVYHVKADLKDMVAA